MDSSVKTTRIEWTPEELALFQQWAKEDAEELNLQPQPQLELVVNRGATPIRK